MLGVNADVYTATPTTILKLLILPGKGVLSLEAPTNGVVDPGLIGLDV